MQADNKFKETQNEKDFATNHRVNRDSELPARANANTHTADSDCHSDGNGHPTYINTIAANAHAVTYCHSNTCSTNSDATPNHHTDAHRHTETNWKLGDESELQRPQRANV